MVEWMDNVEMAIAKLCASKVYTSSEFKREKDNFQSLCKNMERTETKRSNANMFFRVQKPCLTFIRWLSETLDTLTKDRSVEEQKVEGPRLKFVIDRHQSLVPRIQVK